MLETQYRIFKILESNPHATQRQIAGELGVSLGKTNYCLKALVDKGWIKMKNFRNSKKKTAYAYLLTPKGVTEKLNITRRFLERKVREYEELRVQIKHLKQEVASTKR